MLNHCRPGASSGTISKFKINIQFSIELNRMLERLLNFFIRALPVHQNHVKLAIRLREIELSSSHGFYMVYFLDIFSVERHFSQYNHLVFQMKITFL